MCSPAPLFTAKMHASVPLLERMTSRPRVSSYRWLRVLPLRAGRSMMHW
jgi:hypothetical protein